MLDNYMRDRQTEARWNQHDIQVLRGLMSYYIMVEKDYINYVIRKCREKHHADVRKCIKMDLSI